MQTLNLLPGLFHCCVLQFSWCALIASRYLWQLCVCFLCNFLFHIRFTKLNVALSCRVYVHVRVHSSNRSHCLNCPGSINQTSVYKMRPPLIKHYCAPAALLGYWVISCILLVNLRYQGWTGKRPCGTDKPQTRRPELLLPLHHAAVRSTCSLPWLAAFEQQTGEFLNDQPS